MSDQKRASLTTIGSSKKDKKVKEPRRTVRLKVNLSESNEKTCPEYNYVDLLNSVEKRRKLKKLDVGHAHPAANGLGDLDPFAEDDEDKLKEIARSFEERYGPPLTKKKCKKREDYMDIGAGYDETDPFIDNTDAYDEIVPEEMTTAHGGFYINSGALEYKRVEHNSDVSDAEEIKSSAKKKFKKILISDNEDEEEEEEEGDDLKDLKPEPETKELKTKEVKEDLVASNKRKSISREPDLVIKKRKKSVDGVLKKKSMTVKDLLKEKREVEKPEVKPASVTPSALPSPTPPPSVATVGKANESETPTSAVTEPKKSPTTSITDVIESVISAARAQDDSSSNSSSSLSKSHTDSSESSDEEDSMADGEKEKEKQPQKEEIKLPDNLPEDLISVVVLLKNAAKTSAEGKCKFFSAEVNRLLLKVEQSSKAIGVLNRNLVYGHLASYLPCTKDTLMKRAKKLVIENEEEKIKEPMIRLKAVIEKMMPAIIEKHTKDCQAVAEEKGLEETPAGANSIGDAKNTTDGKKTKSGIPLRIFPWNDEVRSLLCEVVKIKLQSFELSKPRKESAKEFLKLFLDSEVRILWPPGWMKTIILYRESRSVHCNAMTKPGKQNVAARKPVNKQAVNTPNSAPQKTNVPGSNSVARSNVNTADTPNKAGAATSGLTKTPTNTGPKMGATASGGAAKANVPTVNSAPKSNSPSNGSSMKSSNTNAGNPKSSSPLSSSTPTITPVSSVSSNSPSVTNNLPPSVSIIKCSTSQTITNTPSQRASSPLSRAVITSVSGSPLVSSNLHVSIAGGGGGKSKAVANSNNSGGDNETPKAPSRTKSPPERNRESVVTKNPVMLSQMNLPDCISVTPANAMQAPATKSPSTPMMSLKQRILQVAGASSGSKQSPDVLNMNSGKTMPSSTDNCEVLLVGEGKREGKLNMSGVRHSGSNHPKSHPMSMGHKVDSRSENEKEIQSKDSRNSYVPRSSPPKDEKASEGRIVDETVTATDVLSQIINSSLGGFPNSSTIGKSGVSVESLSQRRGEHHGDRHPGMLARNISHVDVEGKDKMKDIVRASPTKCSQSSRVENSATVTDAEESVQLEVDRVMKELLELREMTEDSMESESDKRVGHYRPTDKTSTSLPSHMLSSSVSVIAMNSASSKHHTANSQTKMSPSVSQISSNAINSPLSPSTNTQMKRSSSSLPYGSSSNPMPSTKSYGFQDEFQRHMLQDCSKNSVDSDGAVYMGNKVPKDGERNRTANYNSVHRNAPHGSPASLERSQGLHNSADGTNDYDKVLMSLSHLKNMGVRHKQNNPPNAHQYTRHSQPTHNSSEMESCPNINFSGNCVKPRISSQQFSRPEILTQSTNSQLDNFGKIINHSKTLASSLPQYHGMKPYPMRPETSPKGPAPHSTKY